MVVFVFVSPFLTSHPLRVFDEVAPAGSLIDPLGVNPFLDGSLRLADDLPELRVLRELVPVRVPRRSAPVPVPLQQRLPLPAASWTPRGDADHCARCAAKSAPGTRRLCGESSEVSGVAQRRHERTRFIHNGREKTGEEPRQRKHKPAL